jgi:hypothetical protein
MYIYLTQGELKNANARICRETVGRKDKWTASILRTSHNGGGGDVTVPHA